MRRLVITVLGLVVLAGCGGQEVSGTPTGPALGRPAPTDPPTVPSTTEPSAIEPSTTGPADGTNLKACFDGTCEVSVRAPVQFDLDPETGVSHLSIPRIDPNGAQVVATATGGGTITVELRADPGTFARGVITGALSISAKATAGGRALLRLELV